MDMSEIIHILDNNTILSMSAEYLGKREFLEFFCAYIVSDSDPWAMSFMTETLVGKLAEHGVGVGKFVEIATEFHKTASAIIHSCIPEEMIYDFRLAGYEITQWLDDTTAIVASNRGVYIH